MKFAKKIGFDFKKSFICVYDSGHCEQNSVQIYTPLKKVTVGEFLDFVISNEEEWGEISVNKEPLVEYFHGKYVDKRRGQIDFRCPSKVASKTINPLRCYGGWTLANWAIYTQ